MGLPGFEKLVVPSYWIDQLPPRSVELQLHRRLAAVRSGSRMRGVALAIVWNLGGFLIMTQLPGAGLGTAAELVTTSLGFTLWSFVGLLLLLSPSRAGVFEVDGFTLKKGANPDVLTDTIQRVDRMQEDEPARSGFIETIFHPVPSVMRRLRRLRESGWQGFGAWSGARLALLTSWAGLGLLSRAVHCNCGRPELWVLLPSD